MVADAPVGEGRVGELGGREKAAGRAKRDGMGDVEHWVQSG